MKHQHTKDESPCCQHEHSQAVDKKVNTQQGMYVCPMHPEVRQDQPGDCPICGITLEWVGTVGRSRTVKYVCPMHPEVIRDQPGDCPICGMKLEAQGGEQEEDDSEFRSMNQRFWVCLVLTAPLFVLAMVLDLLPEQLTTQKAQWLQFALAIPVVWWGGWPFFQKGWASIIHRSLNMFTLIALGIAVAWGYSVVATFWPHIFPAVMRSPDGTVGVYFEAAAVITTLVLLGQVLELRARSQTSAAIKLLCNYSAYFTKSIRSLSKFR